MGITRYPPRFRLAYELEANLYGLAPTASMLAARKAGGALEAFVAEYESLLQQVGITGILQQLTAIQGNASGVVLLCYEDLTAGEACHRTILGEWLKRTAGIVVPELPDPGRKSPRKRATLR